MRKLQRALGKHAALRSAVPVAAQNIHMTLHFIGAVTEDSIQCLCDRLDHVECSAFTLRIDRVGRFAKSKVLWLGVESQPEELLSLVEQTEQRVLQCIEDYRQGSFEPHITLYRKARHIAEDEAIAAFDWRVSSFVLVESITWAEGVEYRLIKQWPLND